MVFDELAHPIVQAPMGGGPSTPELAIAVSQAGGLGFLAAAYREADDVSSEIDQVRAATDRPDRVIGWHWASPAPVMKLAEIVVTPETSDATVARVVDAATRCGKRPIVVKDNPMEWGFVANRVYFAMVREAQRVVDEGIATRSDVDQLMMDCFRWPSGPFGMVAGAGSGWA